MERAAGPDRPADGSKGGQFRACIASADGGKPIGADEGLPERKGGSAEKGISDGAAAEIVVKCRFSGKHL
jgi:hypothetical protein